MTDHTSASSAGTTSVVSAYPMQEAKTDQQHMRTPSAAHHQTRVNVTYRTIDSPLGPLLLASTDVGLVRVAFALEDFDAVVQTLACNISPRVEHTPAQLDSVARQLEEYFSGQRHTFDLPLDHRLSSGFRRTVQQYLPQIGYGHTHSYKEVAERVGNPRATRAVGTACATNPLPLVVPCHRVLRSDGSLGGYRGGLPAKDLLLTLEHQNTSAPTR